MSDLQPADPGWEIRIKCKKCSFWVVEDRDQVRSHILSYHTDLLRQHAVDDLFKIQYFKYVFLSDLPVWDLDVEQKKAALVRTALWAGDGGLPVAAVLVEWRRFDALGWVAAQSLQFRTKSAMSPRILFDRQTALNAQ